MCVCHKKPRNRTAYTYLIVCNYVFNSHTTTTCTSLNVIQCMNVCMYVMRSHTTQHYVLDSM